MRHGTSLLLFEDHATAALQVVGARLQSGAPACAPQRRPRISPPRSSRFLPPTPQAPTVPRCAVFGAHEVGQQRLGGGTKDEDGDEDHDQGGGDHGGQVGVVGDAVRVEEVVDQGDCGSGRPGGDKGGMSAKAAQHVGPGPACISQEDTLRFISKRTRLCCAFLLCCQRQRAAHSAQPAPRSQEGTLVPSCCAHLTQRRA